MANPTKKKSFIKDVPRPGEDVMAKFYGGGRATAAVSGRPDTGHLAAVSGRPDTERAARNRVVALRCDELRPDPQQPRKVFDATALEELAESIRTHGLLQPVLVRPDPESDGYVLIAGERRWRACQRLKEDTLNAVIHDVDGTKAFELALAENVQRNSLLPLEEAHAYRHLAELRGLSQGELARLLGVDRRRVSEKLSLMELADEVRELLEGRPPLLAEGHAVLLARAPKHIDVVRLAKRCASEGWSVRRLREALARPREAPENHPTLFTNVRMVLNRRGGFTLTVRARSRDEVETTISELEAKLSELRTSFLTESEAKSSDAPE